MIYYNNEGKLQYGPSGGQNVEAAMRDLAPRIATIGTMGSQSFRLKALQHSVLSVRVSKRGCPSNPQRL